MHFESNAEKLDPVDAAMKIEKFKTQAVEDNTLTETYAEFLSKNTFIKSFMDFMQIKLS